MTAEEFPWPRDVQVSNMMEPAGEGDRCQNNSSSADVDHALQVGCISWDWEERLPTSSARMGDEFDADSIVSNDYPLMSNL